jgi:hypothetical protein
MRCPTRIWARSLSPSTNCARGISPAAHSPKHKNQQNIIYLITNMIERMISYFKKWFMCLGIQTWCMGIRYGKSCNVACRASLPKRLIGTSCASGPLPHQTTTVVRSQPAAEPYLKTFKVICKNNLYKFLYEFTVISINIIMNLQ